VRNRLREDFFNREPSELAKSLLGKVLVLLCEDGTQISGGIVETEAYLGMSVDRASHSYRGQTTRNEPMFMKPGTVYVYSIYGMYHCLNISSRGDGTAVLLRAIEPISGIERMKQNRCLRQKKERSFQPHQLCNGPSKMCISYGIDEAFNKMDMGISSSPLWIEDWNPSPHFNIVTTARIGISKKADEWMTAPLRFYIMGCKSVSIADREEEDKLQLS
jgi:DNA-3-methyladenine glycosylase